MGPMNPFYRIYCRVFQQCFHIAIPFLPYRKPHRLSSLRHIPGVLTQEHVGHPLIITDQGLDKLGIAKPILDVLDRKGIAYSYFCDVVANPTTDTVDAALKVYQSQGCDSLIALGGGSSMDTAKGVGILAVKKGKSLSQLKGILKVHKRLPLLIAVPTTAGTGSETTLAAVIVDAKTRHKYAINDFPLIPRYAVLDETFTLSLPPFVTATTGLDALTHAVEAYIGQSTTRKTRRYAKRAVELIFRNLKTAYDDGRNEEARHNMLKASFRAGCAFTVSYVGYVHAIAHSLGGKYNVPHGLANAIILPMMLESYGKSIHGKLKDLAVVAGLCSKDMDKSIAANIFIQEIRELKSYMGIGDTIPEIREEDIPEMAAHAAKEANPLYPVPVLYNAKQLEKYYHMLMEKTR